MGGVSQLDLGAIQCEGNWGPRRKFQENVYCDGERTLGPRHDPKLWQLDNELSRLSLEGLQKVSLLLQGAQAPMSHYARHIYILGIHPLP